ncbi:MAG: N-acetyl sugar amidotransferase [Bacteroidetes bacterium]|nr:N-acetyl sugar amidotransferase [Bacteroidota bacterium]
MEYRVCNRCVLDTNDDPEITFNKDGVCSYCLEYDATIQENKLNDRAQTEIKLNELLTTIKSKGQKNKYDCIIGVSGGVDSTYLVLKAKELGLRPLIVHYDNGWDSELAVMNIENLIKKLDLDLITYVNDWNEFRKIQLAFFKASVIDIELITDQAILATIYKIAQKYKIKYILYGSNLSTEAILPKNWYHWKIDVLNILAIHKLFSNKKLISYPTLSFFKHIYVTRILKIKSINLLNYLSYSKDEAKRTIIEKLDWKDYGGKHHESIFTRFYQSYILPHKFNVDKRKAHLSTLICSSQITRSEALEELKKPIYDQEKFKDDYEYVLKKMGLTEKEFTELMNLPIKKHTDYPSYLTKHYKYQLKVSQFLKPITQLFK